MKEHHPHLRHLRAGTEQRKSHQNPAGRMDILIKPCHHRWKKKKVSEAQNEIDVVKKKNCFHYCVNSDFSSPQSIRAGELGHQTELCKMRIMNNYVWYFYNFISQALSIFAGCLKRTNDRLLPCVGFICMLTRQSSVCSHGECSAGSGSGQARSWFL